MHRFKDLEIWKKSRIFCSKIYAITNDFPDQERFGISNQLRRASVSIPSNIAEGCSRSSKKDFARFLELAIGSGYEIQTQLLISSDLQFVPSHIADDLILERDEIIRMTFKFRSTLL